MAKRGSDSINVNVGTIATGGITIDTGEASKALFNLQSELKKVIDMMSTLARGHNVSAYWNEQAASIQNVYDAAKKLGEVKNGQNLEDLAKAMNAFSAWNPDTRIEQYYEQISDLAKTSIKDIEAAVKGLDSSFSKQSFSEAFSALESIKAAGGDAAVVIQKLNQGDTSNLESKIGALERNINRASSTISGLRDRINELESGDAFAGMEARVEKFAEASERSVNEFRSFLSASGFAGDDLSEWGQFSSLFDQIRDGSLTAKEAMAEVRREYAYMFQGADSGQINDVINRLISLEEQLGSVSKKIGEVNNATGGGSGGIFNGGPGGGPGGPGNFDDILQQILNHLAEINTALKDVSATIGSLGNGADGLQTIVESMSQINALVDELNKKEFKNTIQIGGDTQAVEQLRVYRREAVELVNYVQKMYQSFLGVGHISADIFRIEPLRDAIMELQTMDLDKLQTKIGNSENLGSIEAMRSQLEGYKAALEQIIQITQSHGVDIQLPDSSKLKQATENVRAYEAQAKEATETLAKETAAAQSMNTAIEKASVKTAEIKMGVPEAGASFQEIDQILGSINEKLSQTKGLMPSAFDGSSATESLRRIQEQLAALDTDKKVKLTIDDESLSAMVQRINEALGEASKRVRLKVGSVELPANIQKKLKDATPGITIDTAKLNSESVISAIDKIGASLDRLKEKITSTFDLSNAVTQADGLIAKYSELMNSLGAITKAGVNVASANANTGAASGSGRKQQIDDETAALERQTEAAYKNYDAWNKALGVGLSESEAAKAREEGWKAAEKEAAATEKVVAAKEKEAAAIAKEVADMDKATDAVERHTEAARKSASQINQDFAQAIANMEAGIHESDDAILSEEDIINGLKNAYLEWYDVLSRAEKARAQGGRDADVARYAEEANAIEDLIERVERLDAELAEEARMSKEVKAAARNFSDLTGSNSAKEAAAALREQAKAAKEAAKEIEQAQKQMKSLSLDTGDIKFAGNADAVAQYKAELAELQAKFDALGAASGKARAQAVADFEAQRQKVEELKASLNQTAKAQIEANNLANKIELYASKNGAAPLEIRQQWQQWINELRSGDAVAQGVLNNIKAGFASTANQIKITNNGGKTFFQTLKEGWSKFGGWSIVTRSFTKVISLFKEAVTAVKDVDSAMTELRKVTDLTTEGYTKFYENATQMAGKVGSSLADTINSVANFSRVGFDIDLAQDLAEASLVYQNVADGLEGVEAATSSLISTIKAFGEETYTAMGIVDMFNEVGNHFAISSAGIGEALQRSASSLATAGNTLEESIGLIVAANNVVQNPESVGENLRPAA